MGTILITLYLKWVWTRKLHKKKKQKNKNKNKRKENSPTNSAKTYQMAITRSIIIAGVFAIMFSGVSGQGPATAPGPAMDCFTSVLNLTDCLNFVEVGSNETTPEKGCCPAFAGLIESAPRCLCDLLTKPDSYGIELNRTKALNLPSLCGVTTPPFSLCTG